MDTTMETDLQMTMESTMPVQNGYTNGISNSVSDKEEHKTSFDVKDVSKTLISSASKSTNYTPVQGSMIRKDVFYPYQKSIYTSPGYNLSLDSKRMIRRLQEPVFAASPGTVHLVYEVGGLMADILLKMLLFCYAYSDTLSLLFYFSMIILDYE